MSCCRVHTSTWFLSCFFHITSSHKHRNLARYYLRSNFPVFTVLIKFDILIMYSIVVCVCTRLLMRPSCRAHLLCFVSLMRATVRITFFFSECTTHTLRLFSKYARAECREMCGT